jgi:GTP-binding protein
MPDAFPARAATHRIARRLASGRRHRQASGTRTAPVKLRHFTRPAQTAGEAPNRRAVGATCPGPARPRHTATPRTLTLSPFSGLFHSARFATSVAEPEQLNQADLLLLPEVAFVGRSNAGKSSAINTLTQQRQLAYASKTPGRTQMLNFFGLSGRDAQGQAVTRAYLVDLPGYGFAKVDDATRSRWDTLVGGYLQSRRMLVGVVLVMDARRPLMPADHELLHWLLRRDEPAKIRLHMLLSKADQLSTTEKRRAQASAEEQAEGLPMPTSVQLFSALKREGVEELQDTLGQLLRG